MSSPAITREFMNFLNGSFRTEVPMLLLEPAAYQLHPKYKGMGEILRASNFALAVRSQHIPSSAATGFNQGAPGASQ